MPQELVENDVPSAVEGAGILSARIAEGADEDSARSHCGR
jgi:hypothetical protein